MEIDSSYLLARAVGAGILWIVYSILVLFLVKIQKMRVGALGVLLSCLLGIAATFVPYVGMYLSFPVVVFCLWRFAGTHTFGDAVFTGVISGALMFCFKLFVLASLMGNLGLGFEGYEADTEEIVEATELKVEPVTENEGEGNISTFDWSLADKEAFSLKGITAGARRQLVMFQYNDQMYTLEEGESCGVKTETGVIRVKCKAIHRSNVELLLNDEEVFKLSLD